MSSSSDQAQMGGPKMVADVWVSAAMGDSRLILRLVADIVERNPEEAIAVINANGAGIPLPAGRFPQNLFGDPSSRTVRKLPDFFYANGFWCVSARVAEILDQHDLGGGAVYPVMAWQKDRTTRIAGEYFCLNFGSTKTALVPKESPRLRQNPYARLPAYNLPFVPEDGDVAVDRHALEGPDLWVDPALQRAFFLSGRLAGALEQARLAHPLALFACRVTEG